MRARAAALSICALLAGCTDFDALSASFGVDGGAIDQAVPPEPDLATADLTSTVDAGPNDDLAASCGDGQRGPGETDVDCGGACAPCDVGRACSSNADCQTGSCENARCELVSGPPSWVQVGAPPAGASTAPIARNDLRVERGPDGNLYAFGGVDGSGAHLDDSEQLNQTTLAWSTQGQKLNNPRSLAASTATPTAIYVMYGEKDSGFETSVERMSSAPTWGNVAMLTASVSGAGAAYGGDGKLYVVGGFDGANPLRTVRSFAPGDTSLGTPAMMATPRDRAGVAVGADGRVFALGGQNGGTTLATGEGYAIATNTWAPIAPLPEPRMGVPAVSAPDGRIYLAGGASISDSRIYRSVVAYAAGAAPAGDRWSTPAPLAQARQRHGVAVGIEGRIYVVGGSNLTGDLRTVEAYGPLVTVSPANKQANMTVQVSGTNFARNAAVRFSLASATAPTIGVGTTDGTGTLGATTVLIPAGTPVGVTRLYATDARSRYPVSARLTIDP